MMLQLDAEEVTMLVETLAHSLTSETLTADDRRIIRGVLGKAAALQEGQIDAPIDIWTNGIPGQLVGR